MISSDDEAALSSRTTYTNNDDDAVDAAIRRLSSSKAYHNVEQPWLKDEASARAARLQTNEALEDVERSKRRNDALFLGKFSID